MKILHVHRVPTVRKNVMECLITVSENKVINFHFARQIWEFNKKPWESQGCLFFIIILCGKLLLVVERAGVVEFREWIYKYIFTL